MSWHYLQGQEAASWEASSLDGAPSALLSLIPSAATSSSPANETAASIPSPSGTTSAPSTATPGEATSTSSPEASPAKTSAQPVMELVLEVQEAASGPSSPASSRRSSRRTSSSKTPRSFSLADLSPSSKISTPWGSMRDGVCSPLPKPELHTCAAASGSLLPTPTASHYGSTNNGQRGDGSTYKTKGKPSLFAMARAAGGPLNPMWVELLMGWPEGWTCVDPISLALYCQWLMGTCDDEETRTREIVRVLRRGHLSEEISRASGRLLGVRETAVLLSELCEHENRPDQARVFMACSEALEDDVRGVRAPAAATGASHEPEHPGQSAREYSDVMQVLSRFLAHYGKEAWQDGSWENAVPRVAHGVAAWMDRLKALGNGQVPAVVRLAWLTLTQ